MFLIFMNHQGIMEIVGILMNEQKITQYEKTQVARYSKYLKNNSFMDNV